MMSEWWLVLFARLLAVAGAAFIRWADRLADAVSRTWGMESMTTFGAVWSRVEGFMLCLVGIFVALSALVQIAGV
jgi:hypothetical protein